jgi:hypothetical protein
MQVRRGEERRRRRGGREEEERKGETRREKTAFSYPFTTPMDGTHTHTQTLSLSFSLSLFNTNRHISRDSLVVLSCCPLAALSLYSR